MSRQIRNYLRDWQPSKIQLVVCSVFSIVLLTACIRIAVSTLLAQSSSFLDTIHHSKQANELHEQLQKLSNQLNLYSNILDQGKSAPFFQEESTVIGWLFSQSANLGIDSNLSVHPGSKYIENGYCFQTYTMQGKSGYKELMQFISLLEVDARFYSTPEVSFQSSVAGLAISFDLTVLHGGLCK